MILSYLAFPAHMLALTITGKGTVGKGRSSGGAGVLEAGRGVCVLEKKGLPMPEGIARWRAEAFVDGALHAALRRGAERLRPRLQQLHLEAVFALPDGGPGGRPFLDPGTPVRGQAVFPALV